MIFSHYADFLQNHLIISFAIQKLFNLIWSTLLFLIDIPCAVGMLFRWFVPRHILMFMFSICSSIISAFKLKSLIHLELVKQLQKHESSFSICQYIQFYQHHLLNRLAFILSIVFDMSLSKTERPQLCYFFIFCLLAYINFNLTLPLPLWLYSII